MAGFRFLPNCSSPPHDWSTQELASPEGRPGSRRQEGDGVPNRIARRAKVAGETAGKAGKKVGKAAVKAAKAVGKGATSPEAKRIYKAALDALGETATAVASGDVIVVGRREKGKSLAK